MKFNPFRKEKTTEAEPTLETFIPLWVPVEGVSDLEVLIEDYVVVKVRTGPAGKRTGGIYRTPARAVQTEDALIAFRRNCVAEFLETHSNKDRENEFFENRAN